MSILLIKSGHVVDPASGINEERDVLIENGKIKEVARNISAHPGFEIINAKGKHVFPGLIDMHVHFRDPGREDKETVFTGSLAAALGGFTTVACMANTDPVADNQAVIEYIINRAKAAGLVNVLPVGAITKGLKGEELSEMGKMIEAGAIAFSDDGRCLMDSSVMRHALEYAGQFNKVIISHSEDHHLSDGGMMNESYLSTILGLKGIPASAEESMVQRDILLARDFGRVHIAHVSTAGSVDLIRRAKAKDIPVTCETAPQYFCLTEAAVEGYNTNAKMNPPLRSEKDLEAVISGLRDGTIDCIACDHAPHNQEEKMVEFAKASNGIVGLETSLGLVLTELVETKALTLADVVAKMSLNPANILGLKKGALKPGYDADVTIVDMNKEWTVDPDKFASKSRNTPFSGWKLKGRATHTIVGGRVVIKEGVPV